MITAGAFDGYQHLGDAVLLLGLADQLHSQVEVGRLMLQRPGLDQDIPQVIGHHPLRPLLGGIDAHQRELLGTDLSDPSGQSTAGLLNRLRKATLSHTMGLG